MSHKYDEKDEKYSDDGKDYYNYGNDNDKKGSSDFAKIEITSINITSDKQLISDPINLKINFELDRYISMQYVKLFYHLFNVNLLEM